MALCVLVGLTFIALAIDNGLGNIARAIRDKR